MTYADDDDGPLDNCSESQKKSTFHLCICGTMELCKHMATRDCERICRSCSQKYQRMLNAENLSIGDQSKKVAGLKTQLQQPEQRQQIAIT